MKPCTKESDKMPISSAIVQRRLKRYLDLSVIKSLEVLNSDREKQTSAIHRLQKFTAFGNSNGLEMKDELGPVLYYYLEKKSCLS